MVPYTKNKILFSIGEYRFRDHAQDNDIIFGKIISIDTLKKNYEIISMGHRNPQGLLYDEDQNIILSTEHGPAGGDEINVNLNPGDKVENFGWAIASYGEHYKYPGIGNRTGYDVLKVGEKDRDNPKYKKWPLYKSHKNYGFIEPIKYFTPSIAISEIILIDPKFNGVKEKQIFVGSMGNSVEEGDLSLHYFVLSNEFKIIEHDIFQIKERIRDIVYIETLNKIFLFLESSASIGVLEARN
jgi:glucose/arabinose dehydrogenase